MVVIWAMGIESQHYIISFFPLNIFSIKKRTTANGESNVDLPQKEKYIEVTLMKLTGPLSKTNYDGSNQKQSYDGMMTTIRNAACAGIC